MRYLWAVCLLFLLPAANAAGSAELMEYRSRVMEGAQRHLRAAASIVNDGVELPAHLAEHARALQVFSRMIPEMFPPGSHGAGSDAKAEIWQRWEEFSGLAQRLGKNAAVLEETAADAKRRKQAYTDVLETCRTCHREFRKQ
ncbi:c-type cytochrome [Sulfurivermis fontis]|uniref:c-type cytochrome n=1 Tax=Sulfurivermis fontis TaxID=1972068 RepID=UPI0015587928|nr:cytochrome c [Sulfurivermis fontis]